MKQFQNDASDIIRRMKHIEEFCDVTLVSDDGEKILAHKVVLASASTLFREMFKDYEENKDYKEVRMKGVQSNYMKAMVELVYNGETEIKLNECKEFVNILKQYKVASKESGLSEDKEDTSSKTKHEEQNKDNNNIKENVIRELKNEIKSQKRDILEFQKTFMLMRAEIYKLREENKTFKLNCVKPDIKDKESSDPKNNKGSKNKESETQTEAANIEKESNSCGKSGKEKFKHINCKYFYKGNGCKRGSYCWFSHELEKSMERYCPYWWDGRCRYAAEICRSGKHEYVAINQ